MYRNEAGVGEASRTSGLSREDLFVTTKLWNGDQGHDSTLRAFQRSLDQLDFAYVDLYLIHWPVPSQDLYVETWSGDRRAPADRSQPGQVRGRVSAGAGRVSPGRWSERQWILNERRERARTCPDEVATRYAHAWSMPVDDDFHPETLAKRPLTA